VIQNQDHELSEAEIEASLAKLKALKIHPRDMKENRAMIAKLDHLFEFLKGAERDQVSELISYFSSHLESQNSSGIQEAREMVEEFLSQFELSSL